MAQMETAFPNMQAGAAADTASSSTAGGANTSGDVTVKEEDAAAAVVTADTDNIPEIHFPSSESGDGSGAGLCATTYTVYKNLLKST